jgi:hypothetical protein
MLKKLKNTVIKLLNYFAARKLTAISPHEEIYLQVLRSVANNTPEFQSNNCTPSEKEWFDNMNQLRQLILTDDPRKFLQWDVVRRTMFIGYERYVSTELKSMKLLSDWNNRWRRTIKESPIGCPMPFVFYPASSANLIHHAYHLSVFEQRTGVKIDALDFVMEFGGGYGSMCRVIHKLGFCGRYIIFDLPLFSALQKYFLSTLGLNVLTLEQFLSNKPGILCISDLRELNLVIAHEDFKRESLFIATWSISEAPIKIREAIYPLVPKFKSWLIAYQHRFGEVDNVNFFNSWKTENSCYKWFNMPIEHLPGNSYLVGRKDADR